MNKKLIYLHLTSLILVLIILIPSTTEAKLILRPSGGIGISFFMPNHNIDMSWHGGMRLLLESNKKQRYGIECSYVQSNAFTNDASKTFISTGFILEQRLFDWFLMAIGTIGYISLEQGGGSPFGILTNLGWEPKMDGNWSPFITYRAEFLFLNNSFVQISSISAGITIFI